MSMTSPVDDPLTAALEEAESLMESLGASNEAEFAIYSDDEGELNLNEEDINLHPLHDDFLNTETPILTDGTGPKTEGTPISFSGPTAQPHPLSTFSTIGSTTATSVVTPSMDVLKASTSRFASNLATMAQRAATQVQTAVSTPPAASKGSPFMVSQQRPTNVSNQQPLMTIQSPQQESSAMPELDAEAKQTLIQTHVGDLIPGERVIMFLANLLHVSDSTGFQSNNQVWCCAMTYYRLLLFATHPVTSPPKPASWNHACWPMESKSVLQIPLATMDRVEKSVFTVSSGVMGSDGNGHTISSNTPSKMTHMGVVITSKLNGQQLRFTTASFQDTSRAYDALQNYAFPGRRNLGYLFAFESKREKVMASIQTDAESGKKIVTLEPFRRRFEPSVEFQRQFSNASYKPAQAPWSIWNTANSSYQLCLSYPSTVVGPSSLDESVHPDATRIIRQCAGFRSEHRLPVLTWCSTGGASIWRCSQPKIGLQGNRSSADELYLKHIADQAASVNALFGSPELLPVNVLVQLTGSTDLSNWMPNGITLKILDLRPRSAAMANRTGGYGYENTSNYPGCSLQFCNIANIHAVRDAYQKMSQVCLSLQTSDLQFTSAIEDSKWLTLIRLIWSAAWETAYWVHVHRIPVLVHCSHGWDRTSQVAALAELLLDPYYRTIEGFACLCEKDFMSFGHPLHTRCGHGEGKDGASNSTSAPGLGTGSTMDEGQISPIFIQFLDCVFQIVNQYPECFEFNTKYILCISEYVYSCRFGNFLCDTEREREMVAGIRQRTNSIWDYLDERLDLINTRYSPLTASGIMLMPMPTLLRNICLWTDRHCAFGAKPTSRWLPQGVDDHKSPVISNFRNDHSSDTITQQESQRLILSMSRTSATENFKETETTSSKPAQEHDKAQIAENLVDYKACVPETPCIE